MLVTHSWNALGVGYSSYFQTQKYNNVIIVGSVLLATCPHWPWYFLFVILMRWDSGHWLWSHHWLVTSGEGAVDVVSEMGLSRLTYFNVINWEDHIRTLRWLVSAQAGVGTPGTRKWSANVTTGWVTTRHGGVPGVVCGVPVSPSLSQFLSPGVCRNSWMPPLPVTSPFLSRWHIVTQGGSYPGHQEARERGSQLIIDRFPSWPLWHPAHWVESGWVWCRDCVNSRDVNCQLKLLFLSKKNKNAINSVSNCCISILSFQGVSRNASLPHFCLFWLSIKLLARVINCMLTHSRGVGWLPSFTIIESTKEQLHNTFR